MTLKITVEGTSTNAYAALTIKRLIARAFPEKQVTWAIEVPGVERDSVRDTLEANLESDHASYSDATLPSMSLGKEIHITAIYGQNRPRVTMSAHSLIALMRGRIEKKLMDRGMTAAQVRELLLPQISRPVYVLPPLLEEVLHEAITETEKYFNNDLNLKEST